MKKGKAKLALILFVLAFVFLFAGVYRNKLMDLLPSIKKITSSSGKLNSNIDYNEMMDIELIKMSDDKALSSKDKIKLDLSGPNKKIDYLYHIIVGFNENSLKIIPFEKVRVALFDKKDNIIAGPTSLANLLVYEVGDKEDYSTFELTYIKAKKDVYSAYAWISEDYPEDKKTSIGFGIDMDNAYSKSFYNLKGTIKDELGNPITNAKLFWQNREVNNAINNGEYIIKDIPSGEHTLRIVYNDIEYNTSVFIEPGKVDNLEIIGNENTDKKVLETAKEYHTTPYMIAIKNNLDSINNLGINYTVPQTYKITGKDVIETTDININMILNGNEVVLTKE